MLNPTDHGCRVRMGAQNYCPHHQHIAVEYLCSVLWFQHVSVGGNG